MMGSNKMIVAATALALALVVSGCNRRPAETERTVTNEVTTSPGATASTASTTNTTTPMKGDAAGVDAAFLVEAAKGDFGETQIGKLAQERASSETGKEYGRMLERDHGAHRVRLAALAAQHGITLRDEATEEGQRNYDRLSRLRGAEFDREFGKLMRDDHRKDIEKYQRQANTGPATTAALARETIPTLQHHLEMAQRL